MIRELKEPLECMVCKKPKIPVFIVRNHNRIGIGIKCGCGITDTKA